MSAGIATVVAPMGVMSRRKKSKTLFASSDVDEGTVTAGKFKNLTRDELAQEIERTIQQFGKDSKQAKGAQEEFVRRIATRKFGKGGLRTDKTELKKEQ